MRGPPDPKGTWAKLTGRNVTTSYGFLSAGRWFRVKKEFTDAIGDLHPVGETWLFVGAAYMHYDDVQCFCVSLDGEGEWRFHLMGDPAAQGPILHDLEDYIEPARSG
ncbi:MAG: DUF3601 domain-containing protein [Planctomycetes bacterium]|nr:DUF3601 domain-containing protein [Planctomycetota bacterium]